MANLRNSINSQAQKAIDAVRNQLRGKTGTARELSNMAYNTIRNILPYFSDNAQIIAQNIFDEINYKRGLNAKVEFYDDLIDWSQISSKIRMLANQYAETNPDEFYNQLYYLIEGQVWSSSQQSLTRNCEENDMLFEIVPGPDPCIFCLAMASRGAVHWDPDGYADDGYFHDHCNCLPMPSSNSIVYNDKEPMDYYDEYLDLRDERLAERRAGLKRGDKRFKKDSNLYIW